MLNNLNVNEIDFQKLNGLVPAVIVDCKNNQILMLGFMNIQALEKTIETKLVTFFSRRKKQLWTKGETSGNYIKVVKIISDCDNDSLLIYGEPYGNTCHKGSYSCFDVEDLPPFIFLNTLFKLIKKRKTELPENSYTAKLFSMGENRIIQKVGEEAVETIIAAKNKDKNEIINETSDLIYHLLVLLAQQEIEFGDVILNLQKRNKQ